MLDIYNEYDLNELNRLCAEKIMGYNGIVEFSPTTNISQAWEVLKKLRTETKLTFNIHQNWYNNLVDVTLYLMGGDHFRSWAGYHPQEEKDAVSIAIVRACLKAKGLI